MPSGIQPWTLFVIAIAILTGAVDAAEPQQPAPRSISEREFRAAYTVAMKKFKAAYQNIQCKARCRYALDDPNDLTRKTRYDFAAHLLMKGDSAVTIQNYAKETPRGGTDNSQVACATSHYVFELHKTRRNHLYQLNYFTRTPDRVARTRLILGNDVDVYLCAGSFMYHNPFEEIMNKPSFTVVKLERMAANPPGTDDRVALDFKLTNDPWSISGGHIVFAPQLNWAVLEYRYRCDYSDTNYSIYTGRNTFSSPRKNAIPVPVSCELEAVHHHSGMQPIRERHTAQLTDFSLGTVDDAVFRLSHYGLSDVPLAKSTATTGKQIVVSRCELKDIPANEASRQKITIQNPSSLPLQLLGAMVPCTSCGCASAEGLPLHIPAGQQGSFTILFKATKPGKFNTEIELYTDQPGQTKIKMPLRGTVKANTKVEQQK
ncbi:DUF1573 domain-containing protein [Gimesia panareensis]|uniref:Uncharacterized protein n=1 Tax=Gimesia panareensis TaxID=2527978 RepID=A0A518AG53_9PLAN|nr:DUF1573 domain-containing protein [Gimesia panareensis]QDT30647.1 hypothetical protein Enr10x_60150 [Gimesia panareensis]QDU53703.1 hypothetical protein Pan110_60970 [Gimesia panareensis]